RSLIDTRLKVKLSEDSDWDRIEDNSLMRGSQKKWDHILARTFLRPRDVISFLNSSLDEFKKRNQNDNALTNKDIVNSRNEYSLYLKRELDDEIVPHWPLWEEALQACSAISTLTFDRSDFVKEYDRRKTKKNEINSAEALALLYRFSVIGYERRSGYGGSSWAFQYTDPEAGWDNGAARFKVHLGLKEYAKLREVRQ
ncbi:P-loop ATPase, Sll1717 family, partial [Teichococcus rhizosphaerae]|uniref:P-loop ATPase, Sll1717 family n=1 Tax=Teichococcus rhizosphaerae TaxID=1335062 RepID=UPI001C3F1BD4